ncbi:MAG: hypothetical protein F6K47_19650 [Symploca sp. SIO2E6]|nr:hypothetical protein [Symploca sp. SIO2E6]
MLDSRGIKSAYSTPSSLVLSHTHWVVSPDEGMSYSNSFSLFQRLLLLLEEVEQKFLTNLWMLED